MTKNDKNNLKIVIFHLAFVYSGGGEKLVLKEYDLLKKAGYSVEIFTSAIDPSKCFPEIIKKYEIKTFLPSFIFPNHESFRVILSCILFPILATRFKDFDVVFAANQPSLWMGYILKEMFKVPYVGYLAQPTRFLYPRKIDKETGLCFVKNESVSFSVKLMKVFRVIIRYLDRVSIQNADEVLVNGEYMAQIIRKIYKVNVVSCPSGADYSKNPISLKLKFKKPYILMTNRHAWQKRFEYGLTAFSGAQAKNPDLHLYISGSFTEYTDELKIIIARMGLTHKVSFLRYVNDSDLTNLYKYAICYLYTAPEEDFGMGVIESMGQGTPVIAWNNAGPSGTVINGRTGFLVNPKKVEDFTNKLIELVQSRNLNSKMGKNAIELIKNKYSWKNHLTILQKALNSTSGNGQP